MIDGDDADPWGDTTASSVEPTTQTEEEEVEQEDTEPIHSPQQQHPPNEQAGEPSETRERGKMKQQNNAFISMSSFSEAFQP